MRTMTTTMFFHIDGTVEIPLYNQRGVLVGVLSYPRDYNDGLAQFVAQDGFSLGEIVSDDEWEIFLTHPNRS